MIYKSITKKTNRKVEKLMTILPKSRNKDFLVAGQNMLKNKYPLPPFGVVHYPKGIIWNDNKSRSFLRLIHGQTFLGCLTDSYSETKDSKYAIKGIELILDWVKHNPYPKGCNEMAFHDETTALRLQYWLRFYIIAGEALTDSQKVQLEEQMLKTAQLLYSEEFHSTNTNHGMFQDISLLAYAIYFEKGLRAKEYQNKAVERLINYFEYVYNEDGVHKEHSPSYHFLVSNYVKKLVVWLKELNPKHVSYFSDLFSKTERYATHIIRPDGYFPPLCDTEAKPVRASSYRALYGSDEYLYSVYGGAKGSMPKEKDAVFPESGYAIFRSDWAEKEKATYVLFSAAYHTSYHKHSDDLNIHIYSDGEIITEAGPNGYNYKDKYTKYAYSSFAHNTLIVDGQGLPRVDHQYDKVYIKDYHLSEDKSEVTGVNERYPGVIHSRNVKYFKSSKQINVTDCVSSKDEHMYKVLWHVAPDIEVHTRDTIVELFRKNVKVAEMEISSEIDVTIKAIKEQNVPSVQGWVFPQMESKKPATVIELEFRGQGNVEVTTEFRLDNFKVGKPNEAPFAMEKHYQSLSGIRYRFEEAKEATLKDQLVIIFSALSPQYKFVYNYMKTLDDIDANKLFILDDFGDQGAYYLGKNNNFSIETSVMSLIQYIMAKYGFLNKNITAVGSSKGGFAALYYGIKYHFGEVIAGAPQSKLGDFLLEQAGHSNIAKYISGEGSADKQYLNQILFNLLEQPIDSAPNIRLYVGTWDYHHKSHVLPLYHQLKDRGYRVTLDLEDRANHKDLKGYFPLYLKRNLSEALGIPYVEHVPFKIKRALLKDNKDYFIVRCDTEGNGKLEYAYYIYKDDKIVHKTSYIEEEIFRYKPRTKGEYRCRIFVRNQYKQKAVRDTNSVFI
ncbi:accessory Sec system protein Asp2 [Priestia aryabhattai]|uniref:accessory Sec system protein Asp2 n=1 Tax=Priestia aryabhattai TaxID=412384 RepID=UPI0024532EE8|nr:accessory Sec system protein Asp2 [Priestia aryabhattai]MDH3115857.1 accessory Sec system protein Asp2 [Priestia aryabhattai]MDH3125250.1 accessory Sec system protein Asp2 [Priestia aryabhattai]